MKKKDLFLEESILDDMSQGLGSLELPLSRRVFNLLVLFTFIIGITVFLKVCLLNFGAGNFYKNRALANISDVTVLPAERGIFFDRFGNQLVENKPTFNAVLKISDFLKENKDEQKNEANELEKTLNLPDGQIQSWVSDVNLEKQNLIVIGRNLTIEQIAKIKTINYTGVDAENDFERKYEGNGAFSHLLGYVGLVSPEDLRNNPDFLLNDLVGKSGLEFFYDSNLRGKNGEKINYRNAKNEGIGQEFIMQSIKGNNLYLTIDKEFQDYFYQRLKSQLENLGRIAGVGIAMDPQNGQVLALFNLPSFNAENITQEELSSPNRPLFNRAVSGVYSPGSTIKPLVAVAALTEGLVSTQNQVFSAGFIDIPNPYHPDQPSRFLDWKANGWVNLYSALAKSSNIYFYAVGGGLGDIKGLGIKRLREYWKKFGLEEKTGIDLPNEKQGFLPDVEEKEKRSGQPWRLGDTYNVSIGQGDFMITPLELINYISAIAADGKFYKPYCVEKITREDGRVVKENKPEIIRDLSSMGNALQEVEKGMVDGTQKIYGTSYMLHDLPFIVAAKTGSAQIEWNKKVNAFFVGYNIPPTDADTTRTVTENNQSLSASSQELSVEAPQQIVILVLVEDAREGSLNAVPVARDVFKWYYENRIKK